MAMKRSGRVQVLLKVLAFIAIGDGPKIRDLMDLTGYSRTAMFRLLKVAKDELDVTVESVRGKGYVIANWGVLREKAVVARHGGTAPVGKRLVSLKDEEPGNA